MKESAWEKSEELNLRSASILTQEAKRERERGGGWGGAKSLFYYSLPECL